MTMSSWHTTATFLTNVGTQYDSNTVNIQEIVDGKNVIKITTRKHLHAQPSIITTHVIVQLTIFNLTINFAIKKYTHFNKVMASI